MTQHLKLVVAWINI